MKVLCIGDVVGENGMQFLCDRISTLKMETGADYVIANAENADKGAMGIKREDAELLLGYADVLTGGNHSLDRNDGRMYLENERLLMPANYPCFEDCAGVCLIDTGRYGTLRVISLAGVAWMEPLDNPFVRIDRLLKNSDAKFTIVDFHAESTAEKKALGFYLDGRVSAVFGTHTHVQTADEQILPCGTGFITDVGMTGPELGVLGMRPEEPIQRSHLRRGARFVVADGPCMLNAVLFDLSDDTGLCRGVKRIDLRESSPP